jgi:hypothetical protein
MTLEDLAAEFIALRGEVGLYASDDRVTQCAIDAARFYSGFTSLASLIDKPARPVDESADITHSEWSVIRPLFVLYVERETAIAIESTRNLGVEQIGRSSSEVSADITQLEADFSGRAYSEDLFSVGPEGY